MRSNLPVGFGGELPAHSQEERKKGVIGVHEGRSRNRCPKEWDQFWEGGEDERVRKKETEQEFEMSFGKRSSCLVGLRLEPHS